MKIEVEATVVGDKGAYHGHWFEYFWATGIVVMSDTLREALGDPRQVHIIVEAIEDENR